MSQYDKTNTFALFPVKDRKTDKHPNLSGTLVLDDGSEWFIDGWTTTGKNGNKFINGKVKRKAARQDDVVARVQQGVNQHFGRGDDDDLVPFAPEFR